MLFLLVVAYSVLFSPAAAANASLVKLSDAVNQGAVCLDGSAPGYYFRQGGCAKIGS